MLSGERVRRFDLAADGRYLGFEDMASLTGRQPRGKYDAPYSEAARAIEGLLRAIRAQMELAAAALT